MKFIIFASYFFYPIGCGFTLLFRHDLIVAATAVPAPAPAPTVAEDTDMGLKQEAGVKLVHTYL
jgi:hypothetical protein